MKSLGSTVLLSEPTKGLGTPPLNSLLTALQGSSPVRCMEALRTADLHPISLQTLKRQGGSKAAFGSKLTIKELCGLGVGAGQTPSHTSLSPLTYSLPNNGINQPATNLSGLLCA